MALKQGEVYRCPDPGHQRRLVPVPEIVRDTHSQLRSSA